MTNLNFNSNILNFLKINNVNLNEENKKTTEKNQNDTSPEANKTTELTFNDEGSMEMLNYLALQNSTLINKSSSANVGTANAETDNLSDTNSDVQDMKIDEFYELLDSDKDGEIVAEDVINAYNTTENNNLKTILSYFTDGKDVTAAFKLACSGVCYDSYEDWNKGITDGTDDPDMIAKNGIISKDSLERLTELAKNPSAMAVLNHLKVNRTSDIANENIQFVNDILSKIGITLEEGQTISDIVMGETQTDNTSGNEEYNIMKLKDAASNYSNADSSQIQSFNIGNQIYYLKYDEEGNTRTVTNPTGQYLTDAFVSIDSFSGSIDTWYLNAGGKLSAHEYHSSESHGTSEYSNVKTTNYYYYNETGELLETIVTNQEETVNGCYDTEGNLAGTIKIENNYLSSTIDSVNAEGFAPIIDYYKDSIESKNKITVFDTNGQELYSIDNKNLPYNEEALPNVSNITVNSANLSFEGGQTIEIKAGDNVVINTDKTVTVTDADGKVKEYDANGNLISNNMSEENIQLVNDILSKIGITLEEGQTISDIQMGSDEEFGIYILGQKNSNAKSNQVVSFKIGDDNYVLEYDEAGNTQTIWKNYVDSDHLCGGKNYKKYENWELNTNGTLSSHTIYDSESSFIINAGSTGYHERTTVNYCYDINGNLTGSIKIEDNYEYDNLNKIIDSDAGEEFEAVPSGYDKKNIENKYIITVFDTNGQELYSIDNKNLPYNEEALPNVSNITVNSANLSFEGGQTIEIKAGDNVVINTDNTATVTDANGKVKEYDANGNLISNSIAEENKAICSLMGWESDTDIENAKYNKKGLLTSFTKDGMTYKVSTNSRGNISSVTIKDEKGKISKKISCSYYINGNINTKYEYNYENGKLKDYTTIKYTNDGELFNGKSGSFMYKNGEKLTGVSESDGKYYKDGVTFTGVSDTDGKYYKNGVIGNGVANKIQYVNGEPANGIYNKKMYVNGVLLTGKSDTDNKYYYRGVLANKVTVDGQYCINGKPAKRYIHK